MRIRSLALGGVAGLMGLGLIGVGAHATFTTSATAHQVVSSGSLGLVLYSPTAAGGNTTSSLTLKKLTTAGSTFVETEDVTVRNDGTDPITHFTVTSSATPANTLAQSVWACVTYDGTTAVLYTGPANAANEHQTFTLAPGGSIPLTIQLFAGSVSNKCTKTTTPLPQIALGETATFTMHVVGTG